MGNIGHSQGLAEFVTALEHSDVLADTGTVLRIAGAGVARATSSVRSAATGWRCSGSCWGSDMEDELQSATLGIVTQRSDITRVQPALEAHELHGALAPRARGRGPGSETRPDRRESGAGWVADAGALDQLPDLLRSILRDSEQLAARGQTAYAFAQEHFTPERVAERFERELASVLQPVVASRMLRRAAIAQRDTVDAVRGRASRCRRPCSSAACWPRQCSVPGFRAHRRVLPQSNLCIARTLDSTPMLLPRTTI